MLSIEQNNFNLKPLKIASKSDTMIYVGLK